MYQGDHSYGTQMSSHWVAHLKLILYANCNFKIKNYFKKEWGQLRPKGNIVQLC